MSASGKSIFPHSSHDDHSTSDPDDEIMRVLNQSPASPLASATSTSLTGKSSSRMGGTLDSSTDSSTVKHVNVTCLHKHASSPICFGLIGLNKTSFCLKPKTSCRTMSHLVSQFEPELDHYYINKNPTGDSAWCEFKIHKAVVEELQQQGLNFDTPRSLEDWKLLFSSSNVMSHKLKFVFMPVT
jgi:hypothetical protein